MLALWRKHVVAPEFDFTYSWGSQRSDVALESQLDLQEVFLAHNHRSGPLSKPTRRQEAQPQAIAPDSR